LSYDPGRGPFVEHALFFTGVASSIALPEVICSLFGGDRAAAAFIASAVIGILWGLLRYNFLPFTIISCLSKEPVPKAPPSAAAVKLKRAA
jgi:hypothetical protein